MQDANKFSEKVIMYLWNDVFKFEKDKVFKVAYKTLEDLLDAFFKPDIRFKVFDEKLGFDSFAEVDLLESVAEDNSDEQ